MKYEYNIVLFQLSHLGEAVFNPSKLSPLLNPFVAEELITPEEREKDRKAESKRGWDTQKAVLEKLAKAHARKQAKQKPKV